MEIKLENSARREVKAGAVDVEEDGAFNGSMYGGGLAGSVFSSGVWVSLNPFLLPFSPVGLALPKAIESPLAASACTVRQCPCRLLTPPYSSLLLLPPASVPRALTLAKCLTAL